MKEVFTYDVLFFRSVRYTKKKETVSDTPQQMVSMCAMQANAEQFIGRAGDYVAFQKHGGSTR